MPFRNRLTTGETLIYKALRSRNYIKDVSGWRLDNVTGGAEFTSLKVGASNGGFTGKILINNQPNNFGLGQGVVRFYSGLPNEASPAEISLINDGPLPGDNQSLFIMSPESTSTAAMAGPNRSLLQFFAKDQDTYSALTGTAGQVNFNSSNAGKFYGAQAVRVESGGSATLGASGPVAIYGDTVKVQSGPYYNDAELGDTGRFPLSLVNGWADYGSGYAAPSYSRLNGVVYIEGLIKNGTAVGIATLPVGFRPVGTLILTTLRNSTLIARLNITASGVITCETASLSTAYLSIVCSFRI